MTTTKTINAISSDALLKSWQGHRRLTRRVIEAFPEEELFEYSIGGMRPFGVMVLEIISMGVPSLEGIITGEWNQWDDPDSKPAKDEVLRIWDENTEKIDTLFSQITEEKFEVTVNAFSQWEMPVYDLLLYVIDNEIHHRGQGYVYLRSLGIEPPFFYDRS